MKETQALLHQLLKLGQAMVECGGEVNRVEDTLGRLGRAYGAAEMSVFVITSSIVVTLTDKEGQEITLSRRIPSAAGTDFARLEAYNALSRRCCEAPLPPAELAEKLKEIGSQTGSRWERYVGSMLAVASFTVFFGGSGLDAAVAAGFAAASCLLQQRLLPFCPNRVVFQLLMSLILGLGACGCTRLIPALHPAHIITGCIMLLIPGLAMTNAIRDILVGDTISGIMRLIECLLWAGALAFGFMLAISLLGV